MKNIIPALNKLQNVCMDKSAPLTAIGYARKELFAAIREAIVNFPLSGTNPTAMLQAQTEYLAKFDKLNAD